MAVQTRLSDAKVSECGLPADADRGLRSWPLGCCGGNIQVTKRARRPLVVGCRRVLKVTLRGGPDAVARSDPEWLLYVIKPQTTAARRQFRTGTRLIQQPARRKLLDVIPINRSRPAASVPHVCNRTARWCRAPCRLPLETEPAPALLGSLAPERCLAHHIQCEFLPQASSSLKSLQCRASTALSISTA